MRLNTRSLFLWVIIIGFIWGIGRCAQSMGQDVTRAGGELLGQWYTLTTEVDTLVMEIRSYGVMAIFIVPVDKDSRVPPGMIVQYEYGINGFIFLKDSKCGLEASGWYHMVVWNQFLFMSMLTETCQERFVALTGTWLRPTYHIKVHIAPPTLFEGESTELDKLKQDF